jgi:hypothetical protein
VFVPAEYLGWVEIARCDIRFLGLTRSVTTAG